jgi:hypothetical protein
MDDRRRKESPISAFSLKPDRKIGTSGGITKKLRFSGVAGIILAEGATARTKEH